MKDPLKQLSVWASKGASMKDPPAPSDTLNNLVHPERAPASPLEPVEQINFKAPIGTKERLRRFAAADKTSMLTVFKRALDLYESDMRKRHVKQ